MRRFAKLGFVCCLIAATMEAVTYAADEEKPKPSEQSASKFYDDGFSAFVMGDHAKALEGFARALQVDPKHKDALFFSAVCYQRLGQSEKEVEMYDRLLAIDPGRSVALSNRGAALFQLKRFKEMEESFRKAKAADPKDGHVFLNSGICLLQIGHFQEAHDDLLAAKEKLTSDAAKAKSSNYLLWTKRILRQITGKGTPPADWKPDISSYHTDLRLSRQGGLLIDMPEKDAAPKATGGLTSLAGLVGTRMSFGGSSEKPFEYAPRFAVWEGAVINDPQYGVLLENGTKFRFERVEKERTTTFTGQVVGWKCVISDKKDERNEE